ncbi:MAG: ASPIC/UnbV domain-containing protein [Bryobacteraceae bacterium]|nr:ASPIC/UnbV domain-containing protein [Bryobacteraceae bacterium]
MKGSEGFGSTDPYLVHLGLGARTVVDSLEIRWPRGWRREASGCWRVSRLGAAKKKGRPREAVLLRSVPVLTRRCTSVGTGRRSRG